MGSQQMNPLDNVEVSIMLPDKNTELNSDVFEAIMMLIECELADLIPHNVSDIDMPIIKHPNLKYYTSLESIYENEKEYISYVPFMEDRLIYFNVEKPIADIENYIEDVTIKDNVLTLKFPIYVKKSS